MRKENMMKAYYCGVLAFVFPLCSCPIVVLEGGAPGPAGGYVFYDKGAYSEGWRYLECAPEDAGNGKVKWNEAKTLCKDYSLGGYDDWYVPSIQELTWMYNNLHKKGMGNFDDDHDEGHYWSSEEYKSGSYPHGYYLDFYDGDAEHDSYYSFSCYTRPVRKF
jgi:hypothetical protein